LCFIHNLGFAQIAVGPAPSTACSVCEETPVIEAEADGVRLRIPASAAKDAMLAVM
jgi:hypothetical protein